MFLTADAEPGDTVTVVDHIDGDENWGIVGAQGIIVDQYGHEYDKTAYEVEVIHN